MSVQEALRQLAIAINQADEGFLQESFTLSPSEDTLQITVVRRRKRDGRVLVKKADRLDELIKSDPYALQGAGSRRCPTCGGSGSVS